MFRERAAHPSAKSAGRTELERGFRSFARSLGVVLVLATSTAAVSDVFAQQFELTSSAVQQIEALLREKAARSQSERKVDSQLIYASRLRAGIPIAAELTALRSATSVDGEGRALVDIDAVVSGTLLERIRELGGAVVNSVAEYGVVRANLPVARITELAARVDVTSIRPAATPLILKINTTQGDVAHRANAARSGFLVAGTGVSIGVLSDGVGSLAQVQASGDLPSVTVLPGQAGSGTEGTAMLEIIYDLAPGANLLFATGGGGAAVLAQNIGALRSAGAQIIVDDVLYATEAVFQDDIAAQAVNTVTAGGALYFSAAGNAGNLNDGISGVWEGDWLFSGLFFLGLYPAHSFGGGAVTDQITVDPPLAITLQWSDAIGGSANDYDLYILDPSGTSIVHASTNVQDGNDPPFEGIDSTTFNHAGYRVVVVRFAGSDRFLHVNTIGGRLALNTAGQTFGHSSAINAFSVAAVEAADAGGPGGVFNGTEPVETFSSDGPRRVFYQADGTPITPGNFLSTGGAVRQKPDITAADCVATATPGFSVFCGTSAAAPHAAGIAALMLDAGGVGSTTAAEVRTGLTSTALDIEVSGVDRDSGFGIIEGYAAVRAVNDFDGDGLADLQDSCPTVVNSGLDEDADGVDNICDTCKLRTLLQLQLGPNPVFTGSMTNRRTVSGQLDDDSDGVGNHCDFDHDQTGAVITATDFNHEKASVSKLVSTSVCGTIGTMRCGIFDLTGAGSVIAADDFNKEKAAVSGIITSDPQTAMACGNACKGPFSGPIGSGTEVLGKAICVGVGC